MPEYWLNVAEKPSVAKEIANVLSGGRPRTVETTSRFNPVFEFPFQAPTGRSITMTVTSVAGHLMEDTFPPHTKSWAGYPFQGLFTAKVTKVVKTELEPVRKNLERLAKRATTLVLWLDCDREGENISFEVVQIATAENRRLDVKRAHFSSLTARDINHAVQNLRLPDQRLSEAVDARSEMDLRVGAVFTRFQTIKFRDSLSSAPSGVLSFGPCQFPTLGFLVRRHWEQKGFVPEELFTLAMKHDNSTFSSSRGAMHDQLAATLLLHDMIDLAESEDDGCGLVTDVRQRPNHRPPPVPLATVVLQKLASTHLHLPSAQCMTLAESLYQEGFISYPRTETDSFNLNDGELLELVRVQTSNADDLRSYAEAMISQPSERFRRPLRGGHDDKAHPPIHPTKAWPAAGSDEKGRLYTLICRHFLACLSPDAVAATTSVVAEYGSETFTTGGTTIVARGWLEIFSYERWNSTAIPNYTVGERFRPTEVTLNPRRTSQPANLTETQLISLMDKNGIGTDATIAQHIKTIVDREYARRGPGQTLIPTPLGIALASAYEVLGLSSLLQPQLRAQMELAMADIAQGKATKPQVVEAAVKLYQEIFTYLSAHVKEFYHELVRSLGGGGAGTDANAPGLGGGGGEARRELTLSRLASSPTVAQRSLVPCGTCSEPMQLISWTEAEREHWGLSCKRCDRILRVPSGSHNTILATAPPQRCALCKSYTALLITNREKQTSYTICPWCFSHPPDLEDVVGDEFRCFQCTALDCPLAKGRENIAITRCPSCQENDLRLRTSSTGSYLSCRGYPACNMTVALPKASSIVPCPSEVCPRCTAVMVKFDFRGTNRIPAVEVEEVMCINCDPRLKDYLTVKGFAPKEAQPTASRAAPQVASYSMPSVKAPRPAVAGEVLCGCGTPAKCLTSRKEASRGKLFYTCASRQCSFFQWKE